MSSLKEIKGRIASVRSTLKITSAMKLVSSAKLRKAQSAIETMRPYESALQDILARVSDLTAGAVPAASEVEGGNVAVVAISSNSSLCGAFNGNVIRETRSLISDLESKGCKVRVIPIGKKMAEAFKNSGYSSALDYSSLVGQASYEHSAALAQELIDDINNGNLTSVKLVYNHFISTSHQKPVIEGYISAGAFDVRPAKKDDENEYIFEPSREELLEVLLPKVYKLKFHTAILDSVASEHSARVVAMQTASDNAEDILQDLTLEYNKGRQQKITAELLDIVGGTMQ